jgi:hypothetical protein
MWPVALAFTIVTHGCGDSSETHVSDAPPPAEPFLTTIDLGNVRLTASQQSQTFEVQVRDGSSLVIVADGGNAADIDIDLLRTPGGRDIVTADPTDANPLTGTVSPQEVGGSVATVIVPSSPAIPLEIGTYELRIASFDAAGNRNDATVHLQAIINNRRDFVVSVLPLNVYFVGTPGLDATSAPTSTGFAKVMSEVRRIFSAIGVRVEVARFADVSGNTGLRLGVLDVLDETTVRLVPDVNLNRQADEMDELYALSAAAGNHAVNLFFVDQFFEHPDLLAVASAAPGPSIVQGTSQSGVAAAVRGGLDEQRDPDLIALGQAIASELAGYLGAPPTADRTQLSAEQAFVVLRNPAVTD